MAIKEFVYGRTYCVTAQYDYIPCLPCNNTISKIPTATRIPKGAEVSFLETYDKDIVRIAFKDGSTNQTYHVMAMKDLLCENLLPLFRKNY